MPSHDLDGATRQDENATSTASRDKKNCLLNIQIPPTSVAVIRFYDRTAARDRQVDEESQGWGEGGGGGRAARFCERIKC